MFTLPRFERELRDTLPEGSNSCCVALSGGLDSTVLLVALARLAETGQFSGSLRAAHVDHGLHPDSPAWGEASRDLCLRCNVPYTQLPVELRLEPGASVEATARAARYDALAAQLAPGEVLMTAHHADDQLETVLLQWLRGGGLRAIAGMERMARFGHDRWLGRPLLAFTRAELAAWAVEQQLDWQEDPSNRDRRFDRNYLRLEVLPALRGRWPAAARTVARVAGYARDALATEQAVAATDLGLVGRGNTVDLAALLELPEARQRGVLRAWLTALGLPVPPAETLAALRHDMVVAAVDRLPATQWPGAHVRRYRQRLHAMADRHLDTMPGPWMSPDRASYRWADASTLELVPAIGIGISRDRLPDRLDVRSRAGGERFRPAGGAHRRDLRKWLQEHDVLPWQRDFLPLVYAGEALVAVADLGFSAEFAAEPGEPSWRLVWGGRGIVTEADALAFRWPADPPIR